MMSKKAKFLMTLGIAAVLAGSGTALAATTDNQTTTEQQAPAAGKKLLKVPFNTELPSFLGMTEEELRTAQQEGQTLKAIAEGKGITEAKLLEFMKTQHQKQLDQLLADGKITQEQADDMKAHMTDEHLQQIINGTGKFGGHGGKGKGFGGKGFKIGNSAELPTFLGMTEEELRTAKQEGQTLKAIAEGKGITEAKLIEFLQTEQEKHLAQAVTDGKITQEQADQMKEGMTAERLQEMINRTGGPGKGGRGGHGERGFGGFPGGAPEGAAGAAGSTTDTAATPVPTSQRID